MRSRFLIQLEDNLRFSPLIRSCLRESQFLKARLQAKNSPESILNVVSQLCAAARLATNPRRLEAIEREILELCGRLAQQKFDLGKFDPTTKDTHIPKAAFLKPWIGPLEKGVLFVSFEYQWARLLNTGQLAELASRYTLVASPTWCPPHCAVNYVFPLVFPDTIFCLISNQADLETFPRFSSKYRMIPLLASNWVNAELFHPVPFERKDIDLLMLANFGKYKRHFALFEALRTMPETFKILLIGQANGDRTPEVLRAEAAKFGVENRFELKVNPTDAFVCDALSRARTSLILSRREGSCVAVVESMFANTPVGMMRDAVVGSKIYINEATGRLLEPEDLGAQLTDFIQRAASYRPRDWVIQNRIDCRGSTEILNARLKEHALAGGQKWTQDLAVHHWRPDPLLLDPADRLRMQPCHDEFKNRYGLRIGLD
jgi:glycosyltransferase involved in cell wall biosynthesis